MLRRNQLLAARLHLNQQLAGIKAVNAPAPAVEFFDALLKTHQALVGKTKHIAQAADEVLGLTQLVMGVGKFFGKVVGAVADFGGVERDRHLKNSFHFPQIVSDLTT
jgi:hypothetical protein